MIVMVVRWGNGMATSPTSETHNTVVIVLDGNSIHFLRGGIFNIQFPNRREKTGSRKVVVK